MVPGDHALERMVQRGDSGGRIAVTNLGGMMSLDPLLVLLIRRVCDQRCVGTRLMYMLRCRYRVIARKMQ